MVLDEDLNIQQINASARKIMNISRAQDVIGEPVVRILDPLPYMQVLNTGLNIRNKGFTCPSMTGMLTRR